MDDCIFCKIANGEIPANIVFEDEQLICFHDLQPQAPIHVLLIPKKHIRSIDQVSLEDKELLGHLILTIPKIAEKLDLTSGYRVVNNCGEDGLQTVEHIHFHILGKRKMLWPPG